MPKGELRMLVFCTNAAGMPDVFRCTVTVDKAEYEDGEHYVKAKTKADAAGYETPMVAFDPFDAKALGGLRPVDCEPYAIEEAILR